MKSVPKWSYDNKLYLKDFNRRLEVIFFALKEPSLGMTLVDPSHAMNAYSERKCHFVVILSPVQLATKLLQVIL